MDAKIKQSIDETIKKLSKKYEVREISLPHTADALACYYIIMPAEVSSNMARFDGIRYGRRTEGDDLISTYKKSRGEGLGLEVQRRILLGTYVLSVGYYDAYYSWAQKVRTLVKDDFTKAFSEIDVIVGPTVPAPPFKIGEKIDDPLAMYLSDIYTIPANLAGVPALTLSNGVQLIAPHFEEASLFEAGKSIEHD